MKNKNKISDLGRFDIIQKIKNSGKKDRVIWACLIMIILLIILSGWLYFGYIPKQSDEKDLLDMNKFALLNPIRKFMNQKDLIVNFQPIRDYLNTYEADQNVSIYFEYLNTGANISINKDVEFWPASMLKVPVAMAVAKRVEEGKWKWDNKLVLMPGDKDEKFGTLYQEPTGSAFTIAELVRRALVDSDNTANFILVRNLEVAEITDVYEHIGLADFFSSTGDIGAKKYSVIFRALYSASYLSEENSQKLLDLLAQTEFKNYLQSALPGDVVFAHKIGTGVDKNVYLDSGIVYLKNRPYILTVMIKSDDEKSAEETMKKISKHIYGYVSNYSMNE